MASLLDVIVARNNPQLGGLLGTDREGTSGSVNALSPQQPQQEGGGGVFGRLFGTNEPGVAPEVGAQARRQALIQAGLGVLASNERGLGRLGEGLAFGREAAEDVLNRSIARQRLQLAERRAMVDEAAFLTELSEIREERTEEQERALRLTEVFGADQGGDGGGNITRRTVDAALTGALRAGDLEGAKELRKLRSQFEEEEPVFTNIERQGQTITARVNKDGSLEDPVTGKPLSDNLFRKLQEPRTEEERQDRINALSDDARKDLEDERNVATAVRIGLDVTNNFAGATTLFTMLTRAIDPGVSVRETDIKRGEATATLKGRAVNLYNQWLRKGQLGDQQFNVLKDELERIGRRQQDAMTGLRRYWKRRARNARVDPDLVVPPSAFEGVFSGEGGATELDVDINDDPLFGDLGG